MKEKRARHRPILHDCRRVLLLFGGTLLLICSACSLYFFVPAIYYSFPVQKLLEDIHLVSHILNRADKESDMIAFNCKHRDEWGSNLYTVYPDGTYLRVIRESYSQNHSALNWSPDGIWIALEIRADGHAYLERMWSYDLVTSEIFRIRFDGSVSKRLTYNNYHDWTPQWSRDGASIYFDGIGFQRVVVNSGEIKQINRLGNFSYIPSPSRRFVAIVDNPTGDTSLDYSLHRDQSEFRLLVDPGARKHYQLGQHWAPNDEHFYYTDDTGLYIFNTITLEREFSSKIRRIGMPRWSPNGKWLAIISTHADILAHGEWIRTNDNESTGKVLRRHIHLLNIDTSRVEKLVQGIHSYSVAWSPDSEWLAFVSNAHNGQLFKIKRDGTALQQLTDMDCRITELSWSPK